MAYLLNQVNQILLCCGDLQCINEYSSLDTYLKSFIPEDKDGMVIKETGIWLLKDGDNQEWLGSSPAGLIEQNGILKTVIEIKCPFMGGKPIPYKKRFAFNIYPNSCWKCFAHQQNNNQHYDCCLDTNIYWH